MEPKQNYLTVGIFVLATMLGIVLFLIWMADLGKRGSYETYQTFVSESVNGLDVGSAVKYRGVTVGKVSKITIPERDPTKVRIVMHVNEGTPITKGTVAVLQMQGITGLVYIELKGSVADGEKLATDSEHKIPVIPSAPSQFKQIVDTVPDMLQKFTELADRMGGFATPENQQRLNNILVNLDNFSSQMGAADGSGKTLGEDLHQTVVEMREAAASIKNLSNNSQGDMKRVLNNLALTAEKLNTLSDKTTDLTQEGYQNLHEALLELQKTARDVQSLSRSLKENPSKIIIPNKSGGVAIPKG